MWHSVALLVRLSSVALSAAFMAFCCEQTEAIFTIITTVLFLRLRSGKQRQCHLTTVRTRILDISVIAYAGCDAAASRHYRAVVVMFVPSCYTMLSFDFSAPMVPYLLLCNVTLSVCTQHCNLTLKQHRLYTAHMHRAVARARRCYCACKCSDMLHSTDVQLLLLLQRIHGDHCTS
jgi:hypothetical protein